MAMHAHRPCFDFSEQGLVMKVKLTVLELKYCYAPYCSARINSAKTTQTTQIT